MTKFAYSTLIILIIVNAVSADEIIRPKISLEITQNQMVIDGKETVKLDCPHNSKRENTYFRKIEFSNQVYIVHCAKDYLAGIYLINSDKSLGTLADNDGDEGLVWENQTMIFLDEMKTPTFWRYQYSYFDNSVECSNMTTEDKKKHGSKCPFTGYTCKKSEDYFLKWDEKTQYLKWATYKGKLPQRNLQPSDDFKKHCPGFLNK
jgi:hypothetical protein